MPIETKPFHAIVKLFSPLGAQNKIRLYSTGFWAVEMKMDDRKKNLSRREMLASVAGITGLVFGTRAQTDQLAFTPAMPMGPFYPVVKPLDRDGDLTKIKGSKKRAEGQIIHLAGRVLNRNGQAIAGARIEIWQANTRGKYRHASDPNTEKLDPNFDGYCVLKSDSLGRYRIKSIIPGSYPGLISGRRAPHIHFDVSAKYDRLVTQMFFPGESLNEQDVLYQNLRTERAKNAATAKLINNQPDIPEGERFYVWDIVLLNG